MNRNTLVDPVPAERAALRAETARLEIEFTPYARACAVLQERIDAMRRDELIPMEVVRDEHQRELDQARTSLAIRARGGKLQGLRE